MKVVKSVDVPAGTGAACPLQRGQVLRVVDIKGGQVADFNAWSLPDFKEKFCVRVDVTEEFPFLVNKMSPYYDR